MTAEELRYAAALHLASGFLLTCLVLVHVYLRTFGIQGAFSAMTTRRGRRELGEAASQPVGRARDRAPGAARVGTGGAGGAASRR